MTSRREAVLRFGRFNLIGLSGAALQIILTSYFVNWCRLPSAVASAAGVELALLNNFLWHERFTWRGRPGTGDGSAVSRLWRFHAMNGAVSFGGNALLLHYLVERCGLPVGASVMCAIAVCGLVNFWLADRWVFRHNRRSASIATGDPTSPSLMSTITSSRVVPDPE